MANWDKLNKELESDLDSMSKEDWINWKNKNKMAKYRKKPVEIEAVQLTEETIDEVMEFCGDKIKSHPLTGVVIETLEGNMLASKGDYIIK